MSEWRTNNPICSTSHLCGFDRGGEGAISPNSSPQVDAGSARGAVLARRRDMNEAFYGRGATPEAIVLQRRYKNAKADSLRSALAGF